MDGRSSHGAAAYPLSTDGSARELARGSKSGNLDGDADTHSRSGNHSERSGPSYWADALKAIDLLGERAALLTPTGLWHYADRWFGRPQWLRYGTSMPAWDPFPTLITVEDDLKIMANVLTSGRAEDLLARIGSASTPPLGLRSALIYAAAPDLLSALRLLVRSINAALPYLTANIAVDGDRVSSRFEPAVNLGALTDFVLVASALAFYRTSLTLEWDDTHAIKLCVGIPEGTIADGLREAVPSETVIGSDFTGLTVPLDRATRPNPGHEPMLWLLAERDLADRESRLDSDVVQRIGSNIAAALRNESRVPRLKQIANEEGLSTRTISRLLAAHGSSFREIVDERRKSEAAFLINERSLGLAAVAKRLGFTDQSSFSRSFVRWFGQTPGRFRSTSSGRRLSDVSAG